MRVVITGGGTGGHLFPGLAVCTLLCARRPGTEVLFVGSSTAVEARILPRLGHRFRGLTVSRVSGVGLRGQVRTALELPPAVREARAILREFKAQVVFGVGGYASFATVLAAALLRVPRVIHEQNAYPGLANRWLGRVATAVAVSFPDTGRFFPRGKVHLTGNPIRPEIRPGDSGAARVRLGLERARLTVLVFGGSQGAHRLNLAVQEALPELREARERVQFLHATGERDLQTLRQAYEASGVTAKAEAFFDDMATVYQAADFAICRAGAGTIFELATVGKPALLVPYPHAAHDHQRLNAETMVSAGAAWIVPDQDCDGPRILASLRSALEKPGELRTMGGRARALARPDAADLIAALLERVARSTA
jgi:UDP-N-acetylglucosamine--N-acetylmuramyl-(pentapeptide) pyrophosphoryl-undecaprenol N-acetylglucosamine transferase